MGPLFVPPEAERDIPEGRRWYDEQRQGLGDKFLTAVETVLDRIRETPFLYAKGYRSVRRVRLKRFTYVVHYRIVSDRIEVIAVEHGRRDPKRWKSRVWIAISLNARGHRRGARLPGVGGGSSGCSQSRRCPVRSVRGRPT